MTRDDIVAAVVWTAICLGGLALGSWLIVTLPERAEAPVETSQGEPEARWCGRWCP